MRHVPVLGIPALLALAPFNWRQNINTPISSEPSTPTPPATVLRNPNAMSTAYKVDFNFKEGADVFSPKDLLELARPGAGVANPSGDLVLVPVSKYSFAEKKNKKSIWLAPTTSTVQPYEIPLAKGGEAFWLDSHIVAHAVSEGEGKDEVIALYAINVVYEADSISLPGPPSLIGKFPTATVTNFRYQSKAGVLVFSDNVYEDGNITSVKEQDEAWENRGNSAFVYDETYERHWDTWAGPKRSTLFSVKLTVDPDHQWHLEDKYTNLLHGTGHNVPVEPFGGLDDFDISETHVVYTAKDPKLPAAWHTKQDVHIVAIDGSSKPRELTSGKQGATHSPVLSKQSDKVAWLELDEDGYEADRAKIVVYDLKKNVRYTLTQKWDRSPDALSFSPTGDVIFFTAGDHARTKVFALPIPETPSASTTDPSFSAEHNTPVSFTSSGTASGVQALANGRVLFTRSSITSPNDVFILSGLDGLDFRAPDADKHVKVEQLTKFTEDALNKKTLAPGEDFWFEGARGKQVQGFIVKPPGFKAGEKKKWPVLLLIHGGPQSAWPDGWSTRWNPNVFAQQGYFTVAINPTGSTSFGQDLTDGIHKDWGGKPFVDLRAGWKHVLEHFPEIDTDRAVAAGASYGGFAINWIQGHPEYGFGFKALACHDGSFDTRFTGFATDELFFSNREFGGRPWDKDAVDIYKNNNPLEFVDNWSTPQLLIHGSKDYRLVEAESLAAFHTLQQKGIPSRLIIFPDENHWVLNHGNSLKWHYEVFRWFDNLTRIFYALRYCSHMGLSSHVMEIIDEGYLVRKAGIDPSTGDPWKPRWVSKSGCNQDAVRRWKESQTDDSWGDPQLLRSNYEEVQSWGPRQDETPVKSEPHACDEGLAAKRPRTIPTGPAASRASPYGLLTTGFKSSRKRCAPRGPSSMNPHRASSITSLCISSVVPKTVKIEPPSEVTPSWLLQSWLNAQCVAVEIKHSHPMGTQQGWAKGDFEGLQGTVLKCLNVNGDTRMSTASVKLVNPPGGSPDTYAIPVECLVPIPPSASGQTAVILTGEFYGQTAKLRSLEDEESNVWLVSAGTNHFEIEAERMGRIDRQEGNL
ncbi:hypothetical protein EIP91_006154 [Steccherinum ochraceum]|uniref:Dipeptidyl-peptidase V n=1 Tax=Steccherinum ochraceum TaxID=92696 RepID=A0A4R0RC30_9APHY|nr:hypothetical protein EIP91_006154 [Steccherinum ochraceum]